MHGWFVVSEIALAVVLLVCAGMLGRTLLHLASQDPGVNVHDVLTARAALSAATLENPAKARAAWQDVLERARRVPGLRSIAMMDTVPLREGNNQIGYWTTPVEPPADKQPLTLASSVTPDYMQVMGLALRRGRFFGDQDRVGSEGVVVIDDVMAREAFHGEEPIGKHLWIELGADPVRVVGVVGHVRYWGAGEENQANVRAQLYYPFAQVPDRYVRRWSELMSIGVRTSVDPLSVVQALRQAVRGANNDQVIYELNTMEGLLSDSLSEQRFLLLLFGVFAGLALLLASIGIYGVLAYLTSQRVPEIGVRMALGARAWDVVWLVLQGSLGMIFVGVVLGSGAALGAGRLLERLVAGMQPQGVETFAVMIPVLVAAAMIASFVPALRASRVDPVKALRQE
jgi:predicted permease